MKQGIAIAFTLLALGVLVSGCERKEEPAAPQAPAPAATAPAADGAALGSSVTKGHFEVTLKTEPAAPKAGSTKFLGNIGHHGQPATDVKVKLELSMPTMKMGGPSLELKHTAGGVYEGTADLSMGGDWQAKLTVSADHDTQTYTYKFNTAQ